MDELIARLKAELEAHERKRALEAQEEAAKAYYHQNIAPEPMIPCHKCGWPYFDVCVVCGK